MAFSISQTKYAVRDASEIAFGILILGIVSIPVTMGAGLMAVITVGAFGGWEIPPAILRFGSMSLVVRRYQRIAASWNEERRGKGVLHLLEWITLAAHLLISLVEKSRGDFLYFKLFLSGLMLLMLLSHALTYLLLDYQPHRREIIVWSSLMAALLFELFR
jgi:hypothetical protein